MGMAKCVLTPSNTYCVDGTFRSRRDGSGADAFVVMQHRSAEVIAVNNCIRYLFSAAASGFVLPMIVRSPSLLPLGLLTGDKTATCWRRLDEYARGSAVLGWVWVCSAVYQVWGEDEGDRKSVV
mgnify:CR=1 FL=1